MTVRFWDFSSAEQSFARNLSQTIQDPVLGKGLDVKSSEIRIGFLDI